jgi:UDP-glucose 4-epimerase
VDGEVPYPTTQYGAFKLACEGSARAYWEDHRMPSIGFRPLIVYGPGRGEAGASAGPTLACRAAVQGVPYAIPYTGGTGMVYVDDVAAAMEAAVFAPTGGVAAGAHVFNLAGVQTTVDEVVAVIRRQVYGAAITCEGDPMPIASPIAPDAIATVLPGLATTTLEGGVAATLAYYSGLQ